MPNLCPSFCQLWIELILSQRERVAQKDQAYSKCRISSIPLLFVYYFVSLSSPLPCPSLLYRSLPSSAIPPACTPTQLSGLPCSLISCTATTAVKCGSRPATGTSNCHPGELESERVAYQHWLPFLRARNCQAGFPLTHLSDKSERGSSLVDLCYFTTHCPCPTTRRNVNTSTWP